MYSSARRAIAAGRISAAHTVRTGGIAETVTKMCFGNNVGFAFSGAVTRTQLFAPDFGSLVVELVPGADPDSLFGNGGFISLGATIADPVIRDGDETLPLDDLRRRWEEPLEKVFPSHPPLRPFRFDAPPYGKRGAARPAVRAAKPRALITVFPGTNCEYDSARAFEKAGAEPRLFIMRNLSARDIDESIERMERMFRESQILMIPGGFSAGDEPDGSGKFIAAFFRNPRIQDAVADFLQKRDGLMLGICNGFQALIKLGLVPWGEIRPLEPESPTLTFNTLGRHISRMAYTRITSVKSPWFAKVNAGDVHAIPISHGEGRFVAPEPLVRELFENGQVATRYTGPDGEYADDYAGNPNGSHAAIEGITSPDGRVLGKMGHSERTAAWIAKNIYGDKDQKLFESGVEYFR
jgi:phosphoribosylformylglycinamidine synthase